MTRPDEWVASIPFDRVSALQPCDHLAVNTWMVGEQVQIPTKSSTPWLASGQYLETILKNQDMEGWYS